jgi:hypothetical protein
MRPQPARRESGSAAPAAKHSPPLWSATLGLRVPPRAPRGQSLPDRFGHAVKCGRIRLAVSCSPHRQPHFIRAGLGEMRPYLSRYESHAAAPAAEHSPARRASTLNFRIPPSRFYVVGTCRPLRGYCEVRAASGAVSSVPGARPRYPRRSRAALQRVARLSVNLPMLPTSGVVKPDSRGVVSGKPCDSHQAEPDLRQNSRCEPGRPNRSHHPGTCCHAQNRDQEFTHRGALQKGSNDFGAIHQTRRCLGSAGAGIHHR